MGTFYACDRKAPPRSWRSPPTAKGAPAGVEFWLRTYDPDKHKHGSNLVFASTGGRPPRFDEPYAGAFTRKVAGTKVTAGCKRKDGEAFIDLIVVVKYDKRGGILEGFTINYRADGKRYGLDTRWHIGACGTAAAKRLKRVNHC